MLYLPYSFIGPFAGVFIDRWSRRQILLVSALVRAVLVAITALLIGAGELGVPLYISALAALGVNRFFLASLSAALPHVVPDDKLVMANSVAPTIGGIVTTVAGVIAVGLRLLLGGGHGGAAVIVLVAAGRLSPGRAGRGHDAARPARPGPRNRAERRSRCHGRCGTCQRAGRRGALSVTGAGAQRAPWAPSAATASCSGSFS